jgi:hypothetical protein
MIYPTIVVDDFFKYPNNIKKLSQDLIYEKDKDGKWPGERSKPIHQTNYDFFNFFNQKILSLIYPQNYLQIHFTANTFFKKYLVKDIPTLVGYIRILLVKLQLLFI